MHSPCQRLLHSDPMHFASMANDDLERGKRLAKARKAAGFAEATDAARALGMKPPTYLAHENGSRGFPDRRAQDYARKFKISLEWLLTGKGQMRSGKPSTAPAVGYVGAGYEIEPIDDHAMGAGLEDVDLAPGVPDDAVVVIVRGDSMYPRYKDGEGIFYIRDQRNPAELVGEECIVKLEDGRMFVKDLEKGQEGRFDLLSPNAPPLRNQAVEWAAPVLARVKVRRPTRR
jgi:phage repressor protein C with HTH and peptisase S24 domain